MKIFVAGFLFFYSSIVFAQGYFTAEVTKTKASEASRIPARDFWFAAPQTYCLADSPWKDYEVYISSQRRTTVYFGSRGNDTVKKVIDSGEVINYRLSPAEEIRTSGDVEKNKAIHIWSLDADLSVYYLSRDSGSSDAMYVIPTSGWGIEYVVASYSSLLYPDVGRDLPSEFVLLAAYDNTLITIIPSQDIRATVSPDVILHKKGIPFSVFLNRGECIQFQTTRAQDETWDVTGTIVKSTKPLGLIGASQCPMIPAGDLYCDHILDMIPPVRVWGNIYYTIPFAGRKYGGDSFLAIGSQSGQIIYRNGSDFATVDKYTTFRDSNITEPSVWTSDAPFLLVQYVNSMWFAVPIASPRNEGDPSMMVINPATQQEKEVQFNIPMIDTTIGHPKYQNYVNIILPSASESKLRYDGKTIASIPGSSYTKFPIPGTSWEGIRITYAQGAGEGSHVVRSDSGMGVYVYGYAPAESYAMPAIIGSRSAYSQDTIAPDAVMTQHCYCAEVSFSDIGSSLSGVLTTVVDTIFNLSVSEDRSAPDSIRRYTLCTIDSTITAFAGLSAYDDAGNKTTLLLRYDLPHYILSEPSFIELDSMNSSSTTSFYVSLWNLMADTALKIDCSLRYGNTGFSLDSIDTSPIPNGTVRKIKIAFTRLFDSLAIDTLLFSSACVRGAVSLSAGSTMILQNNFTDSCVAVGDTGKGSVSLSNRGATYVIIDSVKIVPDIDYTLENVPFNILVRPGETSSFNYSFAPLSPGTKNATVEFYLDSAGMKHYVVFAYLQGCVLSEGVNDNIITEVPENSNVYRDGKERLDKGGDGFFVQSVYPNPAEKQVSFVYAASEPMAVTLDIYDMLGKPVRRQVSVTTYQEGIYQILCDISSFPTGTYIYRLQGGATVNSGKLLIEH